MSANLKLIWKPQELIRRVEKKNRRALFGSASYTRSAIRRSLRQASGPQIPPADPGKPPRSRTKRLKNNILFAYDKQDQSMVIGPRVLPNDRVHARQPNVLLLEQGGHADIKLWPNEIRRTGKRYLPGEYKEHPYVEPQAETAQNILKKNLERLEL